MRRQVGNSPRFRDHVCPLCGGYTSAEIGHAFRARAWALYYSLLCDTCFHDRADEWDPIYQRLRRQGEAS